MALLCCGLTCRASFSLQVGSLEQASRLAPLAQLRALHLTVNKHVLSSGAPPPPQLFGPNAQQPPPEQEEQLLPLAALTQLTSFSLCEVGRPSAQHSTARMHAASPWLTEVEHSLGMVVDVFC